MWASPSPSSVFLRPSPLNFSFSLPHPDPITTTIINHLQATIKLSSLFFSSFSFSSFYSCVQELSLCESCCSCFRRAPVVNRTARWPEEAASSFFFLLVAWEASSSPENVLCSRTVSLSSRRIPVSSGHEWGIISKLIICIVIFLNQFQFLLWFRPSICWFKFKGSWYNFWN